jgi:glycogen operon protein
MDRIDIYPTHVYQGFKVRPGRPYPFGATLTPEGVNFSIFSRHANYCVLVLFEKSQPKPLIEIPFRGMFQKAETGEPVWGEFRIGNVFCITVFDLDHENIEYGFYMDGPYPRVARGQPGYHRFDPKQILLDPYAKAIGGREVWGQTPDWHNGYQHRARIVQDDFDWEGDRPLEIPLEDLIIYEMHVRSFTRHPSAGVRQPGTFAAIAQKIPYLKALGVNCVELLPIYEFDEFENSRPQPETGQLLMNYWGYSTVGFFAPKAGYAATGKAKDGTMVADEFKNLVKILHQNGIEVMLDVVFNHTAEGNEHGPTLSFRGIDNVTYYMLTPEGYYYNFSGTGNTLNCNNPIVRNMVLDCLRYWAAEYHIDGFRFDLAAILGRDPTGAPLANPPLLEELAYDPILGKCKLVAEAWDAGGLYQVGSFPAYGRWAEWNGKYRDDIRKFLKGDMGMVGAIAQRLQGSPDLYGWGGRGPTASINFITCHDGFTLADLVSYNDKHNEANGEDNRDGANDNHSWNCGWEGPTDDPHINALRQRQMRNAVAMLMVSQGVPMILMGDEVGRTQGGNNNTYCHDSDLNWLDWSLLEANAPLFRFFKNCLAFRHAHPVLRGKTHLRNHDYLGSGYADITWHGVKAWNADWSGTSRTLAFMLCGRHAKAGSAVDDYIYVALNMYWEPLSFELPGLPRGLNWHMFANTGALSPGDSWEPGTEPVLENQHNFLVSDRSALILVGK